MRGITLYLNDVIDEREREKRRSRAIGILAIAAALFGIGSALYEPPPAVIEKVIVKTVTVTRIVPVEHTTFVPITVAVATPSLLPTARNFSDLRPPEIVDPLTRHLCLNPQRLNFTSDDTQNVMVSNPSSAEIGITYIWMSDRKKSGFEFNDDECRDRVLRGGERCVIKVTLREKIAGTTQLLVASDGSDHAERMTIRAAEQR